jgi:tetratricopeptide (TPR) repeat protein
LDEAIATDPGYVEAHHNLGLVRARQGRQAEAIEAYRRALEVDASFVDAHTSLGTALAAQGRLPKAIEHWRQAVELERRNLTALYNLSAALVHQGEHGEAVGLLRTGLSYAPNSSRFTSLLAWELATAPVDNLRNGTEAVALARRIHQAYPDDPSSADVLAAALAEIGEFEEAKRWAGLAIQLARRTGAPTTSQIQLRLNAYQQRLPFRQPITDRVAREATQGERVNR